VSTKSQSPEDARRASVQPVPAATQPPTPGVIVVGWILILFSVIPLAMGVGDQSVPSLAAGGAMVAIGVVLVLVGRASRRRTG
jgi:uncharacterized membrane protein